MTETNQPSTEEMDQSNSAESDQALIDLFHLDPLESTPSQNAEGGEPEPDLAPEADPAPEPAPTAEQEVPAPSAPTDGSPASNNDPKLLAAMVAEELRNREPNPQPEAQPSGPSPEERLAQMYNLSLPQEVYDKLEDEDPATRRNTFAQVLGVAMMTAHKNALQEVQQMYDPRFQELPKQMQQQFQAQQEAQRVRNDFYGTHPDLNKPALYPLVQQTAAAVMQRTGAKEYNDQVRDTTATVVRQYLGLPGPTPTPEPEPVPQVPDLGGGAGPSSRPDVRNDDGPASLLNGLL